MKQSCTKEQEGLSKIVIGTIVYILISVSFAQKPADSGGGKEKMDVFWLPSNTKPESYELLIVPKFKGAESTFEGETKIILVANEPTNSITLNVRDLRINKVTLEETGDKTPKTINVLNFDYVAKNEQLVVHLEKSIGPGPKYKIYISYTGVMTNDQTGFAVSSYDDNGITKWCAVTRLMMAYARKVFPCYDEPRNKVPFSVIVVKRKDQIALSNMPIMSVEKIKKGSDDAELVRFKPTPPLSTYMVAIFMGEYSTAGSHKLVTVYTHGIYVIQTKYIETQAPKLLQVMKDYTGIQLELPKVDLVDLQTENFEGAHNWGLQHFQDIYIALSDDTSTISKIEALTLIQHRTSYHWVGDLITCQWWDYIWIQYGFERYFKYFALGMAMPNWPTEEWFLYEVFQFTMQFDIGFGPTAVIVKSPDEVLRIETLTASYKTAVIFRMLRYLISEKLFQLSIQDFLNRHKYANVVPDDLYASFDKVLSDNKYEIGNGLSVKQFITPWIIQPGYPYINVTRDKKANTLIITQSKFPADDDAKKPTLWPIGLTFTTQQSKNFEYSKPTHWTDKNSKTTTIPGIKDPGWYIFNIQATGLYRVNYDVENWRALAKQLNEKIDVISVLDRAMLLDDAFSLAYHGLLDYSVLLCFSTFLKNEIKPLVWFTAMNQFQVLMNNMSLDTDENSNKFMKHVMSYFGIIQQKLENMVSKGTSDVDILRAWDVLSSYTCEYGQEDCERNAMSWFNKWLKGEKIPSDIKEATFCTGLTKYQDQESFNRVLDLYMTSTSLMDKKAASMGIGCSPNKTLLSIGFDKIILGKPGKVLKEVEYKWLIKNSVNSDHGFEVMFDFISKNLDKLLNETPGGINIITLIYSTLANVAIEKSDVEKLKKFIEDPRIPPPLKEKLESSLDQVGYDHIWFNMYHEKINQWNIDSCKPYLK